MNALHTPVLAEEALHWLAIRPGGTYVDATVGLGGHALEILRQMGGRGRLIGLDRDAQALEIARERLKAYEGQVTLVQTEFSRIGEVAENLGLPPVDGVLADLGVSSMQLDEAERGFSFRASGPLDMRMDASVEALTAHEIVNRSQERELANLLFQYGEERDSRRIAKAIVRARPIRDTAHLATVVAGARKQGGRQKLHPATKTFLALRIAVNREMEELEQFLIQTPATLSIGGRWVVLAYHSLEDRQVKHRFQQLAREAAFRMLTKKPIVPADIEIAQNQRARSAKMRVVEKIAAQTMGTEEISSEKLGMEKIELERAS